MLFVGCGDSSVACSIAIRRDLSAVPPGQVGFDDMCGLQEYFDALEIENVAAAAASSARWTSKGIERRQRRPTGGKERFAFENDFQLKHLRRVLNENWRRLPEPVGDRRARSRSR